LTLAAACTPGRYVAGVDGMIIVFRSVLLRDAEFCVLTGVHCPHNPGLFSGGELEVRIASLDWLTVGQPPEGEAGERPN
jgi:hypothetical protein